MHCTMTVRHADPRSSATVMSLRPAPFRKPVSNSSCHLEEHPARHAVQQQGVVFPGPPARKKASRVMPDDNQVDLQRIGEVRNLINGIASRKMARCSDVPLTELVHAPVPGRTAAHEHKRPPPRSDMSGSNPRCRVTGQSRGHRLRIWMNRMKRMTNNSAIKTRRAKNNFASIDSNDDNPRYLEEAPSSKVSPEQGDSMQPLSRSDTKQVGTIVEGNHHTKITAEEIYPTY